MQIQKLTKTVEVLETSDLESAIAVVRQRPGSSLILFDLGLPGISRIEALRVFREIHDCVSLVVLNSGPDQKATVNSLACGMMGFIPKASSMPVLKEALETVLSNRICPPGMSVLATQRAESGSERLHESLPCLQLTDRQRQVFRLVVQGKPNKVIARELEVTEATVKSHIRPILQALNVTSRVGAIVEMTRLGLSID